MKKTVLNKKVISLALASVIAATSLTMGHVFAASNDIDPDMKFASVIDFEGIAPGQANKDTPGLPNDDEYMNEMYKTNAGQFRFDSKIGAKGSSGIVFENFLGETNEGVWTRLQMKTLYDGGTFTPGLFKHDIIGGATDFYFWIDTSEYKEYPVNKDPDDDSIVIDRAGDAVLKNFTCQLFLYDKGTSVGESLSAYSPGRGLPLYIQDYDNGGWIEKKCPSESEFRVPAGYVGYVRIPRTSFVTIYGANGDVLPSEGVEGVGDNMFNGPFEFIQFEHMAGGLALEGAKVAFDNFGFLSYEFAEGVTPIDVPKHELATLKGDVNNNGKIDTVDSLLILRYKAGTTTLEPAALKAADFNGDGEVKTTDALLILRKIAGIK